MRSQATHRTAARKITLKALKAFDECPDAFVPPVPVESPGPVAQSRHPVREDGPRRSRTMKLFIRIIATAMLGIVMVGCMTIRKGSMQSVTFVSLPQERV